MIFYKKALQFGNRIYITDTSISPAASNQLFHIKMLLRVMISATYERKIYSGLLDECEMC